MVFLLDRRVSCCSSLSIAKDVDFTNGRRYGSVAMSIAMMMVMLERILKSNILMAIIPVVCADIIFVAILLCDDLR